MIFPVGEILALISRTFTLHPGDVIATGTPEGVGYVRNPPWLLGRATSSRCEVDASASCAPRSSIPAEGREHDRRTAQRMGGRPSAGVDRRRRADRPGGRDRTGRARRARAWSWNRGRRRPRPAAGQDHQCPHHDAPAAVGSGRRRSGRRRRCPSNTRRTPCSAPLCSGREVTRFEEIFQLTLRRPRRLPRTRPADRPAPRRGDSAGRGAPAATLRALARLRGSPRSTRTRSLRGSDRPRRRRAVRAPSTADFVLGCDGGASVVRPAIGATLRGRLGRHARTCRSCSARRAWPNGCRSTTSATTG